MGDARPGAMPDLDTVLERWIPRASGTVNPNSSENSLNGSLRPHDLFVIALQECPSKFKVRGKERERRGKEKEGEGRRGKERKRWRLFVLMIGLIVD